MLKLSLLLVMILLCIDAYAATWKIIHPKPEFEGDKRGEFQLQVLDLALSKTKVRYQISESSAFIRQSRALRMLRENIEVNVVWSMTDAQREADFLPIRIPITKGLIGWRMLLTHQRDSFYTSNITSLEQLQRFSAVQGMDWPDTKILQAGGFNIVSAGSMLDAHNILKNRQADFFPRSVVEILKELNDTRKEEGIRLKPNVVVQYPAAMYFFVNKSNKTLARLLEVGLTRAIEDGSYDRLFDEYFGPMLEELNISDARVFNLANPLLPAQTPIAQSNLWFKPTELR